MGGGGLWGLCVYKDFVCVFWERTRENGIQFVLNRLCISIVNIIVIIIGSVVVSTEFYVNKV